VCTKPGVSLEQPSPSHDGLIILQEAQSSSRAQTESNSAEHERLEKEAAAMHRLSKDLDDSKSQLATEIEIFR